MVLCPKPTSYFSQMNLAHLQIFFSTKVWTFIWKILEVANVSCCPYRRMSVGGKPSLQSLCVYLNFGNGASVTNFWTKKMSLTQHPISESFFFVDVLAKVKPPSTNDSVVNLRPIFDIVSRALGESESGARMQKSVILEDITSLLWIGFSQLDLVRFSRALHALCLKVQKNSISNFHNNYWLWWTTLD